MADFKVRINLCKWGEMQLQKNVSALMTGGDGASRGSSHDFDPPSVRGHTIPPRGSWCGPPCVRDSVACWRQGWRRGGTEPNPPPSPMRSFPGAPSGVWVSNVLGAGTRGEGNPNDRPSARTGRCPCGGRPHSGPGVFFRSTGSNGVKLVMDIHLKSGK